MWFRRDLRLDDNAALYHALKDEHPAIPLLIFDKNMFDELEEKKDKRVEFIYHALEDMQEQLEKWNTSLDIRYGYPEKIFAIVASQILSCAFSSRQSFSLFFFANCAAIT